MSRVAEGSAAKSVGSLVLGGAVGFGLYMLITGLGFGFGGGGRGRGEGREEDRGETPPARSKERLNFLLSPRGFEPRGADWKPAAAAKILTLEEVVARVKDGGRSDLNLKVSGDAIQRDVEAALVAFKQHGIDVVKVETTAAHVSGNARGQYGQRWEVCR
jgi:hypothetical protein